MSGDMFFIFGDTRKLMIFWHFVVGNLALSGIEKLDLKVKLG